jgi:hypothetical protein
MLLWTLQIIILSFLFIFLVHHLLVFFQNKLTVPKVKDLVNAPAKKYEDMYNVMNQHRSKDPSSITVQEKENTSSILSLPEDLENMKFELTNHIKTTCVEKRDISELFTMLNSSD